MPFPAYTVPAVPGPLSLKADPDALAAWPGSIGAVELRQVCDGWPLPVGLGLPVRFTPLDACVTTAAVSPSTPQRRDDDKRNHATAQPPAATPRHPLYRPRGGRSDRRPGRESDLPHHPGLAHHRGRLDEPRPAGEHHPRSGSPADRSSGRNRWQPSANGTRSKAPQTGGSATGDGKEGIDSSSPSARRATAALLRPDGVRARARVGGARRARTPPTTSSRFVSRLWRPRTRALAA